jgi:hypothetical protein
MLQFALAFLCCNVEGRTENLRHYDSYQMLSPLDGIYCTFYCAAPKWGKGAAQQLGGGPGMFVRYLISFHGQ